MQFTILGTTVIIIKDRKVTEAPLDPQRHKAQKPEDLLALARAKALQLQSMGDSRTFF